MDDQPNLPGDEAFALSPRERAMVAEAEASVARDGTIPWDEARAWLESLGTGAPLPMPLPRKQG